MSSGSADESLSSYLFAAIDEARVSYRHAETIVQARFYNYLMAVSILILAWAAFATSDPWSNFLRGVVAMLGLILSVLWSILGSRQRKFLVLHTDMLVHLENQLPDNLKQQGAMTSIPVAELQRGLPVILPRARTTIQLTWAERRVPSRNLLVWAPLLFAITFFLLLARTLAIFFLDLLQF